MLLNRSTVMYVMKGITIMQALPLVVIMILTITITETTYTFHKHGIHRLSIAQVQVMVNMKMNMNTDMVLRYNKTEMMSTSSKFRTNWHIQ